MFNGQGGGKENLFTVQPDGSFLTQISRFAEDSNPQWAINAPAIIYQSTAGVSQPLIFEQLDTSGPQADTHMWVEFEGGEGGTPIPIYGRFPTWIDAGRIAFSGCDGWVGGSRCGIWSMDTGSDRLSPAAVDGEPGRSAHGCLAASCSIHLRPRATGISTSSTRLPLPGAVRPRLCRAG